MPFSYEEPPRYHVEIEGQHGQRETVLRTDNHMKAIDMADFWDLRVNTYLAEEPQDWRSVMDRKWRALERYVRA